MNNNSFPVSAFIVDCVLMIVQIISFSYMTFFFIKYLKEKDKYKTKLIIATSVFLTALAISIIFDIGIDSWSGRLISYYTHR